MEYKQYSVKDVKVGFLTPFEAINDGDAMRIFEEALKSPQSILSKHPKDMELWYVGTFDKTTGEYKETDKKYITTGSDLITEKKFKELDENTLKEVLEELKKIEEEQERERKAFVEIKDKIKIIDEKENKNSEKCDYLEKTKKNIRRKIKYGF